MKVLGLDISKLSATYWILETLPHDPKHFARGKREQKIQVNDEGRNELLSLEFDFAVLEPTGVYSRIWRHWLKETGREYRLVNHEALANYRKSWSMGKTDKLDGLAMAMYGLERCDRPGAFVIEKDYRLSDLILYHQHLNRQKNGFQNNLRQKLAWQLPEWHSRVMRRKWRASVPGLLMAIAGEPNAKWQREIDSSCGAGLREETRSLARILIQIEEEEIYTEGLIDEELAKPQYQPYVEACKRCSFSRWLSIVMIASVFPFEQFLTSDGRPRIVHGMSKNGKRTRKDESLRAFKMSCGMGLSWIASGDFQGWVAGGNGTTRRALYTAIAAAYCNGKKNPGQQDPTIAEKVKHRYDAHGIMKVARQWTEQLYRELRLEFC